MGDYYGVHTRFALKTETPADIIIELVSLFEKKSEYEPSKEKPLKRLLPPNYFNLFVPKFSQDDTPEEYFETVERCLYGVSAYHDAWHMAGIDSELHFLVLRISQC